MDITQTIVQEIVSQCGRHGFIVSASLAHFYLMTQLLKDEKDSCRGVELPPERIEELVDKSVESLTQSDSPALETFKLQASVTTMKQEQVNRMRTEEVQHTAKAQQLIQEICSKTDPNQVVSDMTLYVLHESHLFTSSVDLVQKETMTALESVIARGSVAPFIAQKQEEKAKQLDELWRIVWGIRLFNKRSQKGGAGIPDLPEESEKILSASLATCKQHAAQAEKSSFHYQTVLMTPSLQITAEGRARLLTEYLNKKQFAVYLKNLLKLLEGAQQKLQTVLPQWESLMEEVKGLVSQSSSVPKSTIYPRFIDLSDKWDLFRRNWQDLTDYKRLLETVVAYQSPFHTTLNPSDVEEALATRAEEHPPNKILIASEVQNPSVEYLQELPENKQLEFNGFCVTSILDKNLLLDGKHGEMCPGFIHLPVNDTYYAFSSERALKSFARDPFKYISTDLLEACAAESNLIHLLGMQNELPKDIYLQGTRSATKPREVVKVESHTQTGQIDSYKDHKYEWNEWELRRLALKLANLRNKCTHASQTNQSHHRRENDTQTYLPKTQETQTAHNKATQPSKKVQYIKGLRGNNATKVQVIKMEFDQ
eukprot:TRINITY_DN27610_c0_g1_i1.p1 TRINITY_DN27610_c0_g1~~TRINITY_DN27610_c0_g1_i1.p1  ORF type:complete len:596 (+),score=118.27 TRINITY_DN27610_c0_g1_i1:105-1892(+)